MLCAFSAEWAIAINPEGDRRISKVRNTLTWLSPCLRFAEAHKQEMLAAKRSDFFYTLEEDERKCLASIERIEQNVKKKKKEIRASWGPVKSPSQCNTSCHSDLSRKNYCITQMASCIWDRFQSISFRRHSASCYLFWRHLQPSRELLTGRDPQSWHAIIVGNFSDFHLQVVWKFLVTLTRPISSSLLLASSLFRVTPQPI